MRAPAITEIMEGHGLAEYETRYINIKDPPFRAKGDGITDDTAAIQAAINAATEAGVGKAALFIPACSPNEFMFSNLTLPPALTIVGESMWHSVLKRISGSIGNAIQEDSVIANASKIQLYNFTVQGNGTGGAAISLGNESFPWGTQGFIDNVMVRDFTGAGGIGFDLNSNAAHIGKITVQNCTTVGIILRGPMNVIEAIELVSLAEPVATGMKILGMNNIIKSLYIEGKFTLPVEIDGHQNLIEVLSISVGNGFNVTDLIEIADDKALNKINNIVIGGSGTITNVIDDKYNGVVGIRTGVVGAYDQGGGVTDYSVIYVDDAQVVIPANGAIKLVVMNNLTANRTVYLPALPSGYPIITVINNCDAGNLFKVNVNAAGTDATKKVGGRVAGFPLWAQSSITLKGVDTNIAADKAWERIGGQNNSLFTKQVEIDNAQIKALASTPIQLVPSPGNGYLIELVSAILTLNYSGGVLAEPTEPDDLAIYYNDGAGARIATWDTTGFITAGFDMFEIVNVDSVIAVPATSNVNKNIVLKNMGGDYTGAGSTSTMTVIVTWREHYNLGL